MRNMTIEDENLTKFANEGAKLRFYKEKMYFLIPSFLKAIKHLKQTNQNFSVIFRTFGTDI